MEIPVYIMLGLTSVVGLAFIVERGLALRWRKVVPPKITASLASCETREDAARSIADAIDAWIEEAKRLGRPIPGPSAHLAMAGE